jgi:cellulose synthase/poly-beta-1,6-N-acetylglucosamine synthase-like glycosyltransferase
MHVVAVTIAVALSTAGALVALCAAYLLVLALAAALARVLPPRRAQPTRRAQRTGVLVPAHDEALLIGACVAALNAQTIARDRFEVVVVADNCTDDTARIAAAAGARVLTRDVPEVRGKGHALSWATARLLLEQPSLDTIVVVDADTTADPAFLETLLGAYEAGADAAQGESLLVPDASSRSQLRAAAFLLMNRVRPLGRSRLGLPCDLRGNGMLFARTTLEEHPWHAFTSAEDLEYSVRLRIAGVHTDFVPGAIVRSPTAPTARAAELQRLRWEGGKVHVARTFVPALVASALRRRRFSSLEAAFAVVVPPLGLLAGVAAAGAVLTSALAAPGSISWWVVLPWVFSLASIAAFAVIGLWAGRAPAAAYRALAHGPSLALLRLARVRLLFTHRSDSWVRTERAEDDPGAPGP